MKHQVVTTVVFLGKDHTEPFSCRPSFSGKRIERAKYKIKHDADLSVETIAEDTFVVFNAPEEILTNNQLRRRGTYKGPSLSVGDIVQLWRDNTLYAEALCDTVGWQVRSTIVKIS